MRYLSIVFFVQTVLSTTNLPSVSLEDATQIDIITQASTLSAAQSVIGGISPVLAYLGKIPGREFAKRQIEFLKVSFEATVFGSTGEEAERICQALEEVFKLMINENANERDFYVLGGIINKFILEANPFWTRSNAIEELTSEIYLELGRNILTSGKRVLDDAEEQDLMSRVIMAKDHLEPYNSPAVKTKGYVECLEEFISAQACVEDLV
jgi:hypothetical protein